ncbi:MAG: hypothetical protein KDI56_04870, partial [Xanthomonadales bacterium]|nr:hypothetical protein [Xanthomonadales bacterium]
FMAAFNRIERWVEDRYGIPIRISDVPDPFTADLDGAEIKGDHDVTPEDALFIVAHLFGHTVQWNLSERGRTLGVQSPDPGISEARLAELYDYELEAARLSLALFHEAGVTDLDQWVSDYFHCDWRYLAHFYRTGEKRPFRSFWQDGGPAIEPLDIPAFRPTCWRARSGGIVL